MNAAASVPGLTPGELRQRVSAVAGMIEGDGIVAGSDADGRLRPLRVDPGPLILGAVEWAGLERALAQRARLLDLVLADLYGPRALVTRGLVPPQIVVGHPGFFAAAAGASAATEGAGCAGVSFFSSASALRRTLFHQAPVLALRAGGSLRSLLFCSSSVMVFPWVNVPSSLIRSPRAGCQ